MEKFPANTKFFLTFFKFLCYNAIIKRIIAIFEKRGWVALYQIGEVILYGSTGVCRVTDIVSKKFSRTEPEKLYYILAPLYQTGTITTPAENGKIFTRPVISRDEAISLIDTIPTIKAEAYHNQNLQQLENHYKEELESHDCGDLLRLTMSTYQKKREREQAKLKFGAVDRRYMERAEDLLFGELAVALGIERDSVPAFIQQRLGVELRPDAGTE